MFRVVQQNVFLGCYSWRDALIAHTVLIHEGLVNDFVAKILCVRYLCRRVIFVFSYIYSFERVHGTVVMH